MVFRLLTPWLLHVANSDPPHTRRQEFYALKDRLLSWFGTPDGEDWQHIVKECWACDGTGLWSGEHGSDQCRKCRGTGKFDEFYVRLERYKLGRYTFHIPRERRLLPRAVDAVTIRGYISHRRYGKLSTEAALWLAMRYEPRLWWKILSGSAYCGWTWLPMCVLQQAVYRVESFLRMFTVRNCITCRRKFIRPSRRSIHFQCKRCDRKQRELYASWQKHMPF